MADYPDQMTPALAQVLGLPNFRLHPIWMALRVEWGPGAPRRRTAPLTWKLPRRWNRLAAAAGTRPRVFCASLADVFDNEVPAEWRADLFALIRGTTNLDWLLVTKRIGNASRMVKAAGGWPANVWLGATIVNQEEADRDIPKLLAIDGPRFRFLSLEPLLGRVDLRTVVLPGTIPGQFNALTGDVAFTSLIDRGGAVFIGPLQTPALDWIIVGGESGAKARPMHPDWVISLRDQCEVAGVPFLFKQWGEHLPVHVDGVTSSGLQFRRVGKKVAGRRLHGVTHDGLPA